MPASQVSGTAAANDEVAAAHTPLLPGRAIPQPILWVVPKEHVHRVLFLALSAAVGMAATAATTVYAYGVIMCVNPAHCSEGEKGAFAGSLAISTAIANVCGVVILGPLQHTIRFNPKLGLSVWLISRASSIGVLAVAGEQMYSIVLLQAISQ